MITTTLAVVTALAFVGIEVLGGSLAWSGPSKTSKVYRKVAPSVVDVVVRNEDGEFVTSGSGVVLDTDTTITNCHVVTGDDRTRIYVSKPSTRFSPARYTFRAWHDRQHRKRDLCLLTHAALDVQPVKIGSSSLLFVGQEVYALGAPHGFSLTFSKGVVSQLLCLKPGMNVNLITRYIPRGLSCPAARRPDAPIVLTDATISGGSSGGGLFDTEGNLVGITFGRHGFTLAYPTAWVRELWMESKEASLERSLEREKRMPFRINGKLP